MRLRMVVPHQQQISGGRVYNTEVGTALRRLDWLVEERAVAANWPWPDAYARCVISEALTAPPPQPVLIDGLIGSACPRAIESAVAKGIPVVLLVHLPLPAETGLSQAQREQLSQVERRAIAAATMVATTSHWAAADLRRRYGLADGHVLLPGTSPAPVAAGSIPPQLIMAAALTPVKNHATALAALELISDLSWQAVLVGAHRDHQTAQAVRQHLRTAAHADRIRLPGELSGAALDRAWHDSDLLLVPSWTETFGLAVTEALARGIPAVVSAHTGAVEALTGRPVTNPAGPGAPDPATVAGALADPANPQEWAETLRTWLADPALRELWRGNALRRRAELRSWADTAADLAALLQELS